MAKYTIPVWKMILESIKNENRTNEFLSKVEIRKIVQKYFADQDVNPRTIELQTIFHCVNHPGNKHGGGLHEKNPLFTTDGNGNFKLFTKKLNKQEQNSPSNNPYANN